MNGIQEEQTGRFLSRVEELRGQLALTGDEHGACELEKLWRSVQRRKDELAREGRRFQLAVLGQTKAGKSTFLNALLFGSRDVLPSARVPMTAVLTRMEYDPACALIVEYLTADEWRELYGPDGTPPERAGRPPERIEAQLPEMNALLDDFTGAHGRYAGAVSCVTLALPLEELRGLAVVDTPGFNDPVVSRAARARRFLESCDAAFYLSRSTSFLDGADLELLAAQIPQKGVASLTLFASQFDSALIDVLPGHPSLADAAGAVRGALSRHADKSIGLTLQRLAASGGSPAVLAAAECCRRPVFVSSLAGRLWESLRAGGAPNAQEALILRLLGSPGPEELKQIGNLDEAREIFASLVNAKESLQTRRAQSLLPASQSELRLTLTRLRTGTREELARIEARRPALEERIRVLTADILRTRRAVDDAFDNELAPLDAALAGLHGRLERLRDGWEVPQPREDVVLHGKAEIVSDFQLLRLSTWGSRHAQWRIERQSRRRLDASDVRHAIEQFAVVAEQLFETAFAPFDALYPRRGLPPRPSFTGAADDESMRAAALDQIARIAEEWRNAAVRHAERLRETARRTADGIADELCAPMRSGIETVRAELRSLEQESVRLQTADEWIGRYL